MFVTLNILGVTYDWHHNYLFNASMFHPIFGSSAIPSSDDDVQRKKRHSRFFKNGNNSSIVSFIPSLVSFIKETDLTRPRLFRFITLIKKI